MRPTLVLAVLAVVAAAAVAPAASAAPTVGAERAAVAAFEVTANRQSYQVELLASLPTQASTGTGGVVRLSVTDAGGTRRLYSAPAPVTFTDTSATVRTTLGRIPLSITWTVEEYVVSASFGSLSGQTSGDSGGWTAVGKGAEATLRLGDARCTSGFGLLGTAVAQDTDSYGAPAVQALAGASAGGVSCGPIATGELP